MFVLLFIILAGVLCYFRSSLFVWTLVGFALLLLKSLWSDDSVALLATYWTLFILLVVILNLRGLRRKLITQHFMPMFQRVVPRMSVTEKEALDAGTIGFEAELFQGNPQWSKFISQPLAKLTVEEQGFLDQEVAELCGMIDDWQITHELLDPPAEIWQFLKSKGFFGLIIPKVYGGKGFSALAHSEVLMRLYSRSTTLACIVAVPNSLGPAELLLHYGTAQQKDYYLPRLARGEEIPCFALTGPEAGSDAGAIPDHGIVCKGQFEGKDVIGVRLNWNKRYITLAPVATVLGLAFKLYDPEKLLSDQVERGITCALIPTATPGVIIGRRHFPLNVPFQNGPTQGHDVFIPIDWLIGGQEMAGQGWRMLVECLSAGRAITLPTSAVGQIKMCAHASSAYARIRSQFNLPIGNFEGIEEPLARIAGYSYFLEGARLMALSAIDRGEKPAIVSAIMKYYATEFGRHAVCDAMDIHGGKGICLGPNNYLGRFYQGAPIAITVEGANILTRNMIIFGQGAIRCHPFALKEMQALQLAGPKHALRSFDRALFGHIGYTLSNIVRSLWLSLTNGWVVKVPAHNAARRYLQQITRFSANFALLADMAMITMGGQLKRKESLSARFADVLGYLYLASGAVKLYIAQGQSHDDKIFLDYACQFLLSEIQLRLQEIIRHMPGRGLRATLKFLVMPKLWCYEKPHDKLRHLITVQLMDLNESRARLIHGIDLSEHENNPLILLQKALTAVLQFENLEKRLQLAVREGRVRGWQFDEQVQDAINQNVLTASDAQELRELRRLKMQVINVDDFDAKELLK